MLASIVRTLFVGILALLLVQAGATAATITYTPSASGDDIDGELVLGPLVPNAFFSPDPDHNPGSGSFTDYYYIDVTGDVESITFIGSTLPPVATSNFTLSLHDVTGTGVGTLDFNDTAEPVLPGLPGMLTTALTTSQYVLRVVYNGPPIGTYVGQITATPLPPALLIFGTGLFGLGFLSRYRRRRQGQLGLQA